MRKSIRPEEAAQFAPPSRAGARVPAAAAATRIQALFRGIQGRKAAEAKNAHKILKEKAFSSPEIMKSLDVENLASYSFVERGSQQRSQEFAELKWKALYKVLKTYESVGKLEVLEGTKIKKLYAIEKEAKKLLFSCISTGKTEIVKDLSDAGADVNTKNKDGKTPLYVASETGNIKVAQLLIDRGADVKVQDQFGFTPLHVALVIGNTEVAKLLIDRGADVKAQDKFGFTPLLFASQKGYTEVAKLLIDRGADVKAQDKFGWTPLHYAISTGGTEVAKLLIEALIDKGADLNVKDNNGWTPLDLAISIRRTEIANLLKGYVKSSDS